MQITIITVGKVKEAHYKTAIEDYAKRISNYSSLKRIEIADEKIIDSKQEEKIKEKEGEKIIKAIGANSFKVALSEYGKEFTSVDFSKFIKDLQNKGINEVSFIIGSAIGISETVINSSDFKLALAKMTLPHQMAQLFLLEQIYRAFKIMNNEPYHK